MTKSIMSWKRTDGTQPNGPYKRIVPGILVHCAACGYEVRATRPDGPVLARWTIDVWPTCLWCPQCRTPAPEQLIPPPPRKFRTNRCKFDMGDRCSVRGRSGVIRDRTTVSGVLRYCVRFDDGKTGRYRARDIDAIE